MNRTFVMTLSAAALAAAAAFLFVPAGDGHSERAGVVATSRGEAPAQHGSKATQERLQARSAARPYGAAPGNRFRYALVQSSRFVLGAEDRRGDPATMRITTVMSLVVASRSQDAILARIELDETEIECIAGQLPAAERERHAAAFAHAVDVKLAAGGTLLGYRFAEGLDGAQRNLLRGLIAPLVFPVPADGAERIELGDSSGRYLAGIEIRRLSDGWEIQRAKLGYLSLGGRLDASAVIDSRGRGKATLSRELGWWSRVDADEVLEVQLPLAGARVRHEGRVTLELLEHDRCTPPSIPAGGEWAPVSGAGEDLGETVARQTEARWRERLAGVRVADVVAELRGLETSGHLDTRAAWESWTKLAWLLRLDAARVPEIETRLRDAAPPELARMMLAALAKAGTAEAQQLLASLLDDPSFAHRGHAAIACHQIAAPAAGLVAALARRVEIAEAMDGLGAASLLALGSLAPRNADAIGGAETATDKLLAIETRARSLNALDVWVEALGNAGGPAMLPHLARHAGSPDAAVRAAVASALRSVPGRESLALLAKLVESDPNAQVRARAVDSLAGPGAPARARTLLHGVAVRDPDPAVRRAALIALSPDARDADTRRVLRRVAGTDEDADVRRAASELLGRRG